MKIEIGKTYVVLYRLSGSPSHPSRTTYSNAHGIRVPATVTYPRMRVDKVVGNRVTVSEERKRFVCRDGCIYGGGYLVTCQKRTVETYRHTMEVKRSDLLATVEEWESLPKKKIGGRLAVDRSAA